jgi:hypothetical protein
MTHVHTAFVDHYFNLVDNRAQSAREIKCYVESSETISSPLIMALIDCMMHPNVDIKGAYSNGEIVWGKEAYHRMYAELNTQKSNTAFFTIQLQPLSDPDLIIQSFGPDKDVNLSLLKWINRHLDALNMSIGNPTIQLLEPIGNGYGIYACMRYKDQKGSEQ